MLTERAYSYPKWRMRVGQAAILSLVALGFVGLAVGSMPLWGYAIFVGLYCGAGWWAIRIAPRRKVRETREGLHTWDLAFPVNRLLRWSDIDRFESYGGQLVYAIHRGGSSTAIMGLDAKAVTTWEGEEVGETDDIVAELNRRLALWHDELELERREDKSTRHPRR